MGGNRVPDNGDDANHVTDDGDDGGKANAEDDSNNEALPRTTSFTSLVIGVLSGQKTQWLMRYLQYQVFREIKNLIEKRTGLNVEWVISFILAANSMKQKIPQYASLAYQQVKEQTTSSVTISAQNVALQAKVLRFVKALREDGVQSQFSLRGQHEVCKGELIVELRDGELKQMFRFNGTVFLLAEKKTGEPHSNEYEDRYNDKDSFNAKSLIIRCFGQSNEPIIELLKLIDAEAAKSEKLVVWKYSAGNVVISQERDKRPLDSVDLEPALSDQIRQEVRDFFHEGSKKLYAETSRPYRHGMLFEGPPGTGKTSLAFACASEAGTPLVIINAQGMDDCELEASFARLPIPCTVLVEDIDACGIDVSKRTSTTNVPVPKSNKKEQKISKREAADYMKIVGTSMVQEAKTALSELFEVEGAHHEDLVQLLKSRNDFDFEPGTVVTKIKRVTLSGILNVLDGASAVEGRLLIMTTNHPETLDEAVTRAGRCDSKFHITYATVNSAERTFKRIFGGDPCSRYSSEAIDRFAQAFKNQFPEHSKIPTCDLTRYFGRYRNKPTEAIQNFSTWLERGDDMFTWSIQPSNEEGLDFNVARPYDAKLLKVDPKGIIEPPTSVKIVTRRVPEATKSIFNPLSWFGGSHHAHDGSHKPSAQLLLSSVEDSHTVITGSVFDGADGGFNLDDVEYDELPDFELFDIMKLLICSALPKALARDTQPLQTADIDKFDHSRDVEQLLLTAN